MSEELEIITLEFEDAPDEECEVLGVFEACGKEYIALLPTSVAEAEAEDEDADVYIYGYRELDNDQYELVDIEDDAEFEEVGKIFDQLMEEI